MAEEGGDLAKSNEERSAVGVVSGRFAKNSPTLSLLRLQNPKTPLPDSEDAETGVLGLFALGIWIDWGRFDSVECRVACVVVFGVVLMSDKGAGVEVLLGPAFGTGGGPMADVGV